MSGYSWKENIKMAQGNRTGLDFLWRGSTARLFWCGKKQSWPKLKWYSIIVILGFEVNRLQLRAMSVLFWGAGGGGGGGYLTTAWGVHLLDQDRWPGGCPWLLFRRLSRSMYTYLLLKPGPITWNRILSVSSSQMCRQPMSVPCNY